MSLEYGTEPVKNNTRKSAPSSLITITAQNHQEFALTSSLWKQRTHWDSVSRAERSLQYTASPKSLVGEAISRGQRPRICAWNGEGRGRE